MQFVGIGGATGNRAVFDVAVLLPFCPVIFVAALNLMRACCRAPNKAGRKFIFNLLFSHIDIIITSLPKLTNFTTLITRYSLLATLPLDTFSPIA